MSNNFKIKVCGMRDAANIEALSQLPIDYMGFIFYPSSPRYVGIKLDINLLKSVPEHINKVGVFVNESLVDIQKTAEKYGFKYLQLHGNETPDYCLALKDKGYVVIKAFKAEPATLTCETANYRYACDYFLFDTPTIKHGGSGKKFDWEMLKQQKLRLPFFLSGGIAPDDEEALKALDLPELFSIDINSQFEIEPGLKDIEKIKDFISKIH